MIAHRIWAWVLLALLCGWWGFQSVVVSPMIDESFYAVASSVGNVYYITGDARLWPVLSGFAHRWGGLPLARAVGTAGTLGAALCLWLLVGGCAQRWTVPAEVPRSAWWAVGLFVSAAPVQVVLSLATYDALALLFWSVGLLLLHEAIRRRMTAALWGSALLLVAAAATRFFYHGPLLMALLLGSWWSAQRGCVRWYVGRMGSALLLLLGLYWWDSGWHIRSAIAHASAAAASMGATESRWDVLRAVGQQFGAWLLVGGVAWMQVRRTSWRFSTVESPPRGMMVGWLLAAALPIGYHLYSGHTLALNRNLAVTAWCGAIPMTWVLLRAIGTVPLRWRAVVVRSGAVALLLCGLWTAQGAYQWADWRPVVRALRHYAITDRTAVWVVGSDRVPPGEGKISRYAGNNVWLLRQAFGVAVDTATPWHFGSLAETLDMAQLEHADLIVGALLEATQPVGTRIGEYHVTEIVPVPHGDPVSIWQRVP